MKNLLLSITLLVSCLTASAQKLEVLDFKEDPSSAEARTKSVVDPLTGRNCALLCIKGDDINKYKFSGKIVGEPQYSQGEVRIYMGPGARYLEIRSENNGNLDYDFPDVVLSQMVYSMTLYYNKEKTSTLIMPLAGLGKTNSYGAMLGIVKKYGGYIKGKYNFKSVDTELECNEKGFTNVGNEIWFNGGKEKSRLAITGGALVRLAKPTYLYAGLGYGDYTSAWETSDGKWAKNTDASVSGIEVEAGIIARWKSVAFSAGIETCQMKYWELNVGIGIFM